MNFSYETVTSAAEEAISDMATDVSHADPAPRRAVGAGVYLMWAHLVGNDAKPQDTARIVEMIKCIR